MEPEGLEYVYMDDALGILVAIGLVVWVLTGAIMYGAL